MSLFKPNCLPLLIGSLPSDNHRESVELIFDYTPQIPLWPQLPVFKREGMILQYAPGFPGITERDGKVFVDTGKAGFEEELLALYEDYLMVSDDGAELDPVLGGPAADVQRKGEVVLISIAALDTASKRNQGVPELKERAVQPDDDRFERLEVVGRPDRREIAWLNDAARAVLELEEEPIRHGPDGGGHDGRVGEPDPDRLRGREGLNVIRRYGDLLPLVLEDPVRVFDARELAGQLVTVRENDLLLGEAL